MKFVKILNYNRVFILFMDKNMIHMVNINMNRVLKKLDYIQLMPKEKLHYIKF